jgi:predicted anti-sigma-YlaC factor YlaD
MEYFEKHPTLDVLELHLMDHLEGRDKQDMIQHLDACDNCRHMAAQMNQQIEFIRQTMAAA